MELVGARRPVVQVTQGTIDQSRRAASADPAALAGNDVVVVGTTGGESLDDLPLPGNARVAAFIPFAEIMARVSVATAG